MHPLFDEFMGHLSREDKEACVGFALEKLSAGELDIFKLYLEILTPAQNELVCWQDESYCIWREHVRTSIVRSVIECAYPFVLDERKRRGLPRQMKAVIGCPSEEYHEIGARMVADYFTILGFDVTFIGANTPQRELLAALEHVRPRIIGISVTNFYNLVAAKNLVGELRRLREAKGLDIKIVVGGNAFRMNKGAAAEMGVDAELRTFTDLELFCRGL
jgi:methanogenic corrinoid protein MtbC1